MRLVLRRVEHYSFKGEAIGEYMIKMTQAQQLYEEAVSESGQVRLTHPFILIITSSMLAAQWQKSKSRACTDLLCYSL